MTNHKMDMIASIADCYSKGALGTEDAYLLTVRVIEGSLSVIELLHILAKMKVKPNVGHHYDCNHDCDALYEAYHKGFFEGYEERKEEEKKDNRKAVIDKMNEAVKKVTIDKMDEDIWRDMVDCFGEIQKAIDKTDKIV